MTATEYLKTKYILLNTTAIINADGHFRLFDGRLILEAEFKEMHKLPVCLNRNENNPDRTRLWLG
jgi:hypothetical protein